MKGPWDSKKRIDCEEVSEAEAVYVSDDVLNSNNATYRDQENTSKSSTCSGSSNDDKSNSKKFTVDYSKRGTTKCRYCKKFIVKGMIRLGKSVAFKTIHIIQYFHVNCAFESFRKARSASNIIMSINEIEGIENVSPDEKSDIA